MAAKIYTTKDAPIAPLKKKTLAVIGFGSQGHAHALNLKDSGLKVIIGLYKKSKSWEVAKKLGFEVKVGFEILKSLGLRHRGVTIISCPSCARQGFDVIRTVQKLEEALGHIKTPMSLSVLGCVVNGPGEALYTDVGFTGGGKGAGMVYLNGKIAHKQANEGMIDHIVELVEAKAAEIEAGHSVSMDVTHGKAA